MRVLRTKISSLFDGKAYIMGEIGINLDKVQVYFSGEYNTTTVHIEGYGGTLIDMSFTQFDAIMRAKDSELGELLYVQDSKKET